MKLAVTKVLSNSEQVFFILTRQELIVKNVLIKIIHADKLNE